MIWIYHKLVGQKKTRRAMWNHAEPGSDAELVFGAPTGIQFENPPQACSSMLGVWIVTLKQQGAASESEILQCCRFYLASFNTKDQIVRSYCII